MSTKEKESLMVWKRAMKQGVEKFEKESEMNRVKVGQKKRELKETWMGNEKENGMAQLARRERAAWTAGS
jgi:murein L,D-transpeptidase YafK